MSDRLMIEIEAKDSASSVISEVESSLEQLKNKLNENKEAIKTLLSAWTKAEHGVVKLRTKISETTKSLRISGKQLSEMAKTIGSDFGSSLSDSINKSLSDLPDLMFSWGSNAASMFASGMNQGSHEIEASAYKISDMLAGYFEMHSPARIGPLSKEDPAMWTKRLVTLLATGLVSAEDILTEKLQKISGLMVSAFDMTKSPSLTRYIESITTNFADLYRKIPTQASGEISKLYSSTGVDFRKSENIVKLQEQDKLADEFKLFRELLTRSRPANEGRGIHSAFAGGDDYDGYLESWFTGIGSAQGAVDEMLSSDQRKFSQWLKKNPDQRKYFSFDEEKNRWKRTGRSPNTIKQLTKMEDGRWRPENVPEVAEGVMLWDDYLNKEYEGWLKSTGKGTSAYSKASNDGKFRQWNDMEDIVRKYINYVKEESPEGWTNGVDRSNLNKILGKFSDTDLANQMQGSEIDPKTGLPLELTKTKWWSAFVRKQGSIESAEKLGYGHLPTNTRIEDLPEAWQNKLGLRGRYDLETAIKMVGLTDDDDSSGNIFGKIYNMMKNVSGRGIAFSGGETRGWMGDVKQDHFGKIAEILGVDYVEGAGKGYKKTSDKWSGGDWDKLDLKMLNRVDSTKRQFGMDDKETADYLAEKIATEWKKQRTQDLYTDEYDNWKLADSTWTKSNQSKSAELLIEMMMSMPDSYARNAASADSMFTNASTQWTSAGYGGVANYGQTFGHGGNPSFTSPLMYDFTQHFAGAVKKSRAKDPRKYFHGRDQYGNDLYMPRARATEMMRQNDNWIETDYVDGRMAQLKAKREALGLRPDHSSTGLPYSPKNYGNKPAVTGGDSTSLSVGAIQVNQTFNLDLGGYEGSIQELISTIAQEAAIEAQKALLDMVEFRGV